MARFSIIPLSEMPEPSYVSFSCEGCGATVTREQRHQEKLQGHSKGRGAAFCGRTCHGRWLGTRNRQ